MIKVKVNKRIGFTTSVIPHSSGLYPVWVNGKVEFVEAANVKIL